MDADCAPDLGGFGGEFGGCFADGGEWKRSEEVSREGAGTTSAG